MSDDGYTGGVDVSGYYSDELEDLLYDADPEQDLADDLASHALHSPVYQDDPGYELLEYYSDWDYYSDDYYDDDPAILKNNPQDGSSLRKKVRRSGDSQKRGKKRKLVEVHDIPELDLGERRTLKDCMRGTVWAKPIPERDNVFVSGQEDKIALLKDWKQIFGTTSVQDKGGSDRPPLPEDESWANDMSLADMGLTNERGSIVDQNAGKSATDLEKEDAEEGSKEERMQLDEETAAALLQQMEDMDEDEAAALFQKLEGQIRVHAAAANPDPPFAKKQHPLAEAQATSPPSFDYPNDSLTVLPKRRKHNHDVLPSPPQSTESPTLERAHAIATVPIEQKVEVSDEDQQRETGRPRKGSGMKAVTQATSSSTAGSRGTRKRKPSASPPPDRSRGVSKSTASSRAKRVASNVKDTGAETSEKEISSTNVSTRSTRSRKRP